jgi:SAM-dependent methyltransferase
MNNKESLDAYVAMFSAWGETHITYLKYHFYRFLVTKKSIDAYFLSTDKPVQLLDIGAHWLHQTCLYAQSESPRYVCTAVDMPFSFLRDTTQRIAECNNIKLVPSASLASGCGLSNMQSDIFDAVLFSEIIEHITFNPISFWKEIYRVLKPGGIIFVTTPNYYYWRRFPHSFFRMLKGWGVGISVDDLLKCKTTAPHWKEYSMKELARYFHLISEDFSVCEKTYAIVDLSRRRIDRAYNFVEKLIPCFRKNLFIAVRLRRKDRGIRIDPTW